MRALALAISLLAAGPLSASECFIDNATEENPIDGAMRLLMFAHTPIEYRNSCGLLDETDQRYFEAVRAGVGCEASDEYNAFFGRYLGDDQTVLFAAKPEDLRSEEAFLRYCEIVKEIDLTEAVNPDGSVNSDAVQSQEPLFFSLRQLVAATRRSN